MGVAKKFGFAAPEFEQARAWACTATRLCTACTQLSAPLVSASSILQSPESQSPRSPPREEQHWPDSLSNTPCLRSLHTRLLAWPSCLPAFLPAIEGARNKTQCLLALENSSSLSSPPVLKISWHGPSFTMLMSFLPTSTIFLVLSCAAGRCARGAPS